MVYLTLLTIHDFHCGVLVICKVFVYYADLANVVKCLICQYHYQSQENGLLCIRNLTVVYMSFTQLWFSVESSNFIISNIPDSYFFKWQSSLFSFSRKCLPNTQVWITIICLSIISSNKKCFFFLNKKSSSCRNSTAQVLFLRKPLYFIHTQSIKKMCI